MDATNAIAEFWRWWPEGRVRIERAIEDGAYENVTDEISARVKAIDPDLDWELGPGVQGARHAFCLSAKGDPEGRRVTERWMRAGPAPDATWEYHPARMGKLANVSLKLSIAGHDLAFEELRASFEVDESREHVHVFVYHPLFADMPEDLRRRIAFLALDNTLGEDGVERWIGSIDAVSEEPEEHVSFRELLEAVQELEESATGERFAVLKGERDGAPIFVTLNMALKRIDHLACDAHAEVTIHLLHPTEHGLPTREESERLDALEDELVAQLADGVVYVGRETTRGVRIIYFFAPELGAATQIIESWAARHRSERAIDVTWRRDPRWELLARWM